MPRHPAIGFVGLGLLGSALADRLVAAGHTVIGWDSATERRNAPRERGGDVATGAQQVFSGCSRVLLTLPSHREAAEVMRNAGATLGRDLTIIGTTIGDPASTESTWRCHRAVGRRREARLCHSETGSSPRTAHG